MDYLWTTPHREWIGKIATIRNKYTIIPYKYSINIYPPMKFVSTKKKRISQNDNLSPRKNGVVLKRQQPIPKVENNYPRSSPFHHPGQWEIKQNPVQPGLSAEPTINHSRLFPQIHLAASACASFSEGGQYVVRRRIDCLRSFTMKRRGREKERERRGIEEGRAEAGETKEKEADERRRRR